MNFPNGSLARRASEEPLVRRANGAVRPSTREEAAVELVAVLPSVVFAVLLVAIAIYFALRQRHTFALLRHETELSADDRRYLHQQAVRRLANSVLLIILAAFLVGGVFLETHLNELRPAEPLDEPPEAAKESLRLLTGYWITVLLVLLGVMLVAVFDLVATARYGAHRRRQLIDDRRAALEDEVERLRRDRHGLNGGL
jgi:hypothetical protein